MRKQLDPRIPILINNNVKKNHRSFIVLVGDKGRDQVRERLSSSQYMHDARADCKFALFALTIARICPPVGLVVLQERAGLHQVRISSILCGITYPDMLHKSPKKA